MFNTVVARGINDVLVDPRLLDVAIPALNGHFAAVSGGAMYAMLAGGGQLGGVRILSEETSVDVASEKLAEIRVPYLGAPAGLAPVVPIRFWLRGST